MAVAAGGMLGWGGKGREGKVRDGLTGEESAVTELRQGEGGGRQGFSGHGETEDGREGARPDRVETRDGRGKAGRT